MKKLSLLSFICIILCLLCSSCLTESSNAFLINDYKTYFEHNAQCLLLPDCSCANTKSFDNTKYSIYPDWDEANITDFEDKRIVEVPLNGNYKISGKFVKVTDGKVKQYRATTVCNLVMEYSANSSVPQMYIETYIQKGKKCDMTHNSAVDGKTLFVITSDLNGEQIEHRGYCDGLSLDINRRVPNINPIVEAKHDFFGVQLFYVTSEFLTRVGFCPYGFRYICLECSTVFYASWDENPICPVCGEYADIFLGQELCPDCGKNWTQCACQNSGHSCAPCGRNKDFCCASCEYDKATNHGTCTCP